MKSKTIWFCGFKKEIKSKIRNRNQIEWMNEWMPFMGCKLSNQLLI